MSHSQSSLYFFPDTTAIFGLNVEVDAYRDMLQRANFFLGIRTHLQQEIPKLKFFTARAFHKSTKKKLFHNNIRRMTRQGTETQALMPLFDKGPDRRARFDLFLLVCFSFSDNHFRQIEQHNLTEIFPHMLRRVIERIDISHEMMGLFAKIIRESCGNDEGSKCIVGS